MHRRRFLALTSLFMAVALCFLPFSPAAAAEEKISNELTATVEVKDVTPPQVQSSVPAHGSTNVPITQVITVVFSETVTEGPNFGHISLKSDSSEVSITKNLEGAVLTIRPVNYLSYNTRYTLTIPAGAVADKAGNYLEQAYTLDFTTGPRPIGGGGGGGGTVSPPVQPPVTPPGAVEPIKDEVIEEALTKAQETGKVVIQAPENVAEVAVKKEQVDRLIEAGRPVVIELKVAAFELPPEILKAPTQAAPEVVQVQVKAQSLAPEATKDFSEKVANTSVYAPAASIIDLAILGVTAKGEQVYVRAFEKPVKISLPVPANMLEQAEKGLLVVGRLNEIVMRWEEVPSQYDPQKGTMVFETNHLSLYALLEKKAPPLRSFADISGHWAQRDIEIMAGLGIARGVGENKFNPNANITRAEFLAFLIRTLNLSERKDLGSHFVDVSQDSWYYSVVETAYGAGLASGYGDGTFKPEWPVTREEIAAWLDRAAAYAGHRIDIPNEVEALLGVFSDTHAVSNWARQSIAASIKAGILHGRPEGKLDPLDTATRAEALVMLKRLLVYMKQLPE